jgi:hypothetical protein
MDEGDLPAHAERRAQDAQVRLDQVTNDRNAALVRTRPIRHTSRRPAFASGQTSQLSANDMLKHFPIERQVSYQVLQLAVLTLEFLQRRTSVGSRPSHFFFQLMYVTWLIPALRQLSPTGMPSFIETFMVSAPPSLGFDAETSNQKRSSFAASDHPLVYLGTSPRRH